jgi:hypothetical protein
LTNIFAVDDEKSPYEEFKSLRRLEESRPLDRLKGGYEDFIFVIYKAKQGSLISVENLKEMKRFAE